MEALRPVHLDTHVALWLYGGRTDLVSKAAAKALDKASDCTISPMVLLEIQYLYEIDRIGDSPEVIRAELERLLHLRVSDVPFEAVASRALSESWTRVPFDRIIVAQAAFDDASLLSRDRQIAEHYSRTVW